MDKNNSSTTFSGNIGDYNLLSKMALSYFPHKNGRINGNSTDQQLCLQNQNEGICCENRPFDEIITKVSPLTQKLETEVVPSEISTQTLPANPVATEEPSTKLINEMLSVPKQRETIVILRTLPRSMTQTESPVTISSDTTPPTANSSSSSSTMLAFMTQGETSIKMSVRSSSTVSNNGTSSATIHNGITSPSYVLTTPLSDDSVFLHENDNRNEDNDTSMDDSDNDDDDEDDGDNGDDDDDDDDDGISDNSDVSNLSGLSDLSSHNWKPIIKPISWLQERINCGADPRELLSQILGNGATISPNINNSSLWRMLVSVLSDPPRRQKLQHINTIDDVVRLLKESKNIIVLTGAGVSVSCGIPDFRSIDGIYSRLSKEFPDLPDPQSMFDIHYFSKDPRPFYKFAKEIYPGQFTPSACHRFIKLLEKKQKLLRNYTQNIDTLERVAGIQNVIECHGSFATASCTRCNYKTAAADIRDDIFAQRIPLCPICQPNEQQSYSTNTEGNFSSTTKQPICYSDLVKKGIMKPDIVFFGEGLSDTFHSAMSNDKDKCDLLIVIGSSLKVRPVALIPSSIPSEVPQILINREQLCHLQFDVELLGDSDVIINQLCHVLDDDWSEICFDPNVLVETKQLKSKVTSNVDTDSQSTKLVIIQNEEHSISNSGYCDSGFESSSSSNNPINDKHMLSYQIYSEGQQQQQQQQHRHHHHHHHHRFIAHKIKQKQAVSTSSPQSISGENDVISLFDNESQTVKYDRFARNMENENVYHIPKDSSKDNGICATSNSIPATSSSKILEDEKDRTNDGNSNKQLTKTYNNNDNNDNNNSNTNVLVNLAERLYENSYYRSSESGVYLFPGAQLYCNYSDTEDNDEIEDDDEDDNGIEVDEDVIKVDEDDDNDNEEGNVQDDNHSNNSNEKNNDVMFVGVVKSVENDSIVRRNVNGTTEKDKPICISPKRYIENTQIISREITTEGQITTFQEDIDDSVPPPIKRQRV